MFSDNTERNEIRYLSSAGHSHNLFSFMNTEYECHACQGSTASGAKSQVQKPHLKSVGRAYGRSDIGLSDGRTDVGRVPGRHNWTQTRMRRRSERRRAFAKLAEAPFRPHSMRSCLRNHTQKLPGPRSGCVIRLSANARSESSLLWIL